MKYTARYSTHPQFAPNKSGITGTASLIRKKRAFTNLELDMNEYLFVHIIPFSDLGHNSSYTKKTRGVTTWTAGPAHKFRPPLRHRVQVA
jgi:hypothetical protein